MAYEYIHCILQSIILVFSLTFICVVFYLGVLYFLVLRQYLMGLFINWLYIGSRSENIDRRCIVQSIMYCLHNIVKYGVLNKEYRQYFFEVFLWFFSPKSHYLRPKTHIFGSLGTPESPPYFGTIHQKEKVVIKFLKPGRHWSQGYHIKDPKYRLISIALRKKSYSSGWSGGFMFSNNQLALTIKWQGNRKTDCTQLILWDLCVKNFPWPVV